jgi:hypothetical protein
MREKREILRSATKEAVSTGATPGRGKVRNASYGLPRRELRAVPPSVESITGTRARFYSPRWHLAACWRALESVAGELGDPPRASRYAELAQARDDLPSPPILRARLGSWSSIAAALLEQQAARGGRAQAPALARGRRTAGESIETERLPTQVEVAALAHLAAHPGSSGNEVKIGAGIRSASQTWALLARLEREGLLVNDANGSGRAWKNAWRLSKRGRNVLNGLPEGMYAVS